MPNDKPRWRYLGALTDAQIEEDLAKYGPKYLEDNHFIRREWTDEDENLHEYLIANEDQRTTQTCPKCKAVGTYRARFQPAYSHPRYYVCKYCGYHRNILGEWKCWPDKVQRVWGCWSENSEPTPKERVEAIGPCNPWLG